MTRKTKTSVKTELPPDVLPADLEYPKAPEYDTPEYKEWSKIKYDNNHHGQLTFYKVGGRSGAGWVICTLPISAAKRGSGLADRTYAIAVKDEKVYTVGRGPHVEAVVTVQLHPGNLDRLQKYVELWAKGLADAGSIRDRISSRRAQGQLYRAAGRSHWSW